MKKWIPVLLAATLILPPFVSGSAFAVTSTDRERIEDLCNQMEAAYTSLDSNAVIALYHHLGPRGEKQLNRLFERSNSVKVELEFKELNPSNTEAVVLLTHITLVHKWCNRKLESYPRHEYRVRKIEGDWKFVQN